MKWEPEIPRWRQVYAVMSEQILDGTYEPGARLPSAMAICDEFGISQVTAKRVLTELRKAGLAEMQVGIGTFVTELPRPSAES
jgi:GntR family transcriptional regulator